MPRVPLRMRARSVFLRRDSDDEEGGSLGEDPLEVVEEEDAPAAAAAPEDVDPDELEVEPLDEGAACMLGLLMLLLLLLLLLLDEWRRRRRCVLVLVPMDARNGDEEDSDNCDCLHWIAAILNLMARPDEAGALILQLAE